MNSTSSDRPARVAVVTGAARGIGAGVAHRLAADGLAVALVDIDGTGVERVASEISAAGSRVAAIAADVADEDAVKAAVERVVETLGEPTVLVNNAGIIRDNLLFKMTVGDWDEVMGVHLRGPFLMSRAVEQFMRQAGWGRIVNISSSSALGNRGQANYAAAKAGVQGFTKTLAKELGPFGVTVNAIAPGFIETEMTMATAERMRMTFDDFRKMVVAQTPVGRSGMPEDIAHAASFFASEGAGYVSGQVLYVAGGPLS